jgi:hypothetical protein
MVSNRSITPPLKSHLKFIAVLVQSMLLGRLPQEAENSPRFRATPVVPCLSDLGHLLFARAEIYAIAERSPPAVIIQCGCSGGRTANSGMSRRILVRREKGGHFCSAEKIGDCYAFENEEQRFNNGPRV